MRGATIVALGGLLLGSPALAYDSRCYIAGEECKAGPQAARGRWVGPSDEHRQIFEASMDFAGLPEETRVPLDLEVYTDGTRVDVGGAPGPSLIPAPPSTLTERQDRLPTVAEFAQLPDFGYSLYDWALGLETCPADAVDAVTCHEFSGHMGMLNSNHFLPQAQGFYRHYHHLALDRAAECKRMTDALGAQASRFNKFTWACEKEALLIEAIAHHYLQDAWSSGHMWARWGSPNRGDFPSVLRGLVVAATAGIIHGARALLQPLVPFDLLEVNDAMCAPHPEVEWSHPALGHQPGMGDLYLERLSVTPELRPQHDRLYACAVAGIRAVYAATGRAHGALAAPTGPATESFDPESDECFGQRVTNRALWRGFGIDYINTDHEQKHLRLTPAVAAVVLVAGTAAGAVSDDDRATIGAEYAMDLVGLAVRLEWSNLFHPAATDLAEGGVGDLLGIAPNGVHVMTPPAEYADPPLPWRFTVTDPQAALLRTFHRAHAGAWCDAYSAGTIDLADLSSRITVLTQAIEGTTAGDPARAALEADKAALCEACVELATRHVRVGQGPGDYDVDLEPLCVLLDPQARTVYASGTSPAEAASTWCGCGDSDALRGTPIVVVAQTSLGGPEDLYVLGSEGGARQLTHNDSATRLYYPRWSPDRAKITYSSSVPPYTEVLAHSIDADGTNPMVLSLPTYGLWSPDGSMYLTGLSGMIGFTVVDAVSHAVRAEVPGGEDPSWSPDGRIAFARRGGIGRIYVINSDGTGEHQVTDPPGDRGDSKPHWSPDGAVILYQRLAEGIWRVDPDGSSPARLSTSDPAHPSQASFSSVRSAWSPDGTRVLHFRSFADEPALDGYWLMDRDGSNPTRLEVNQGALWSPDGSELLHRPGGLEIYRLADGAGRAVAQGYLVMDDAYDW